MGAMIIMNTVQLIRGQIKTAHDWLEGTVADVTPTMANFVPPGQAHSVGTRYAHLIVAEDTMTHAMLQGGASLYTSTFAGKTSVADPPRAWDSKLEWAQSEKVDISALKNYAQAVYKATDDYVAKLKEVDLDKEVDLTQAGFGKWALGAFLITFLMGHVRDIMGEISAINGVQGAKGYPI